MSADKIKILIAEDDPVTQKIAAMFVESMGFIPFVSPNGKHAYEAMLAYNSFDLLLTDIMMPEMNGEELIRTIRTDKELKNTPIIIMSAVVGVKDISHLLKTGATLFMAKPLERGQFEEYVRRCLP